MLVYNHNIVGSGEVVVLSSETEHSCLYRDSYSTELYLIALVEDPNIDYIVTNSSTVCVNNIKVGVMVSLDSY